MFQSRSTKLERIDTGDYSHEEYEDFLREIRLINRWAGDSKTLRNTLFREIERRGLKEFSVLDIGAGSGELLRQTACFARKRKKNARLFGLELNPRSAKAIRESSAAFPEIEAIRGDAFELPFGDQSFDYAISSLFAHHFPDNLLVEILREMSRVSKERIFLIDLHRHRGAYLGYRIVSQALRLSRMVREDGSLSILRGFRPSELESLAKLAGIHEIREERHFPFRICLSGK